MTTAAPIFVSYSQPDRSCAFELVERIEAAGLRCWIAPRDVSPSADWAAEIIEAIAAARIMVLVFSSSSNRSAQVRREVERAAHKEVRILPFRIEDVPPSNSLEYFLSTQHWLDAFPGPIETYYGSLCAHLVSLLEQARTTNVAVQYSADDLERVERALAGFVGPIARHLVKRAAAQGQSLEELVRSLSSEIENDGDRRRFGALCVPVRRPLA